MNKKIKFLLGFIVLLTIILLFFIIIIIKNFSPERPPKYPFIICIDNGEKILGIVDVCRNAPRPGSALANFTNKSSLGFTLIKFSEEYNLEEAYVEYFDYSGEFLGREKIKEINYLNLNDGISGFGFSDNPEVMKIAISSKINKDGGIIDCGMSQIFEVKECIR